MREWGLTFSASKCPCSIFHCFVLVRLECGSRLSRWRVGGLALDPKSVRYSNHGGLKEWFCFACALVAVLPSDARPMLPAAMRQYFYLHAG